MAQYIPIPADPSKAKEKRTQQNMSVQERLDAGNGPCRYDASRC